MAMSRDEMVRHLYHIRVENDPALKVMLRDASSIHAQSQVTRDLINDALTDWAEGQVELMIGSPVQYRVTVGMLDHEARLIPAIKFLRQHSAELGLKEAKDLCERMQATPIRPRLLVATTGDSNSASTLCGLFREVGFDAVID